MSNRLRRAPLSRLLAALGLAVALGAGAAALALAVGSGPTPPPKPLAEAVHDALAGPQVQGVSARIQFTDHLVEGAALEGLQSGASAGSPLLTGASGRLWISSAGKIRAELQSERGDTQLLYDGSTISLYEAASMTLYRYTLPPREEGSGETQQDGLHQVPSVKEIQEAIERIMVHARLSEAIPTDVAGRPAYSVQISPLRNGGLVGSAEVAFDAAEGVPLRLAVYSTTSSAPVLEALVTEISYEPVEDSVFQLSLPEGVKVTDVKAPTRSGSQSGEGASKPVSGLTAVQEALPFTLDAPGELAGMARSNVELVQMNGHSAALITYGEGLGGIAVLEGQAKQASGGEGESESALGQLPTVSIGSATATELPTALGTVIRFERSGISYLVAGSVTRSVAESAARGL